MLKRCIGVAAAWTSGALGFAAINAVLLFRAMDDPARSGQLAANGFYASYLIALVVCLVALGCSGHRVLSTILLALTCLMIFWVVPALREHGRGWPFSFASLHSVASLGHFLLALGTLGLSWRVLRSDLKD